MDIQTTDKICDAEGPSVEYSCENICLYCCGTKSLQSKWLLILRVIPHCEPLFADLENLLSSRFCYLYLVWRSLLLRDNCFTLFNLVVMSNNCYNVTHQFTLLFYLVNLFWVVLTLLFSESILDCATFELDAHAESAKTFDQLH